MFMDTRTCNAVPRNAAILGVLLGAVAEKGGGGAPPDRDVIGKPLATSNDPDAHLLAAIQATSPAARHWLLRRIDAANERELLRENAALTNAEQQIDGW
jgi:hypothetical protein